MEFSLKELCIYISQTIKPSTYATGENTDLNHLEIVHLHQPSLKISHLNKCSNNNDKKHWNIAEDITQINAIDKALSQKVIRIINLIAYFYIYDLFKYSNSPKKLTENAGMIYNKKGDTKICEINSRIFCRLWTFLLVSLNIHKIR